MRSHLAILALLTSVAHAKDLKLNCTLEYDIDDKRDIEIPLIQTGDITKFELKKDNLVTYYIPSSGPADWHNDSSILFQAELRGEVLTYHFNFKNYLRDRSQVESVYSETRELVLDFSEINDGEKHYFDYRDGDVLTIILTTLCLNSFACGGGEVLELNDDKQLVGYGLIDKSSTKTYMFADDIKAGMMKYFVTDSNGNRTHKVALEERERYILVELLDLRTEEVLLFKGQYGMSRGCNELIPVK